MWMVAAAGSALLAGLTAVLVKLGIRNTDSEVATAARTLVVLVLAWLMAGLALVVAGTFTMGIWR